MLADNPQVVRQSMLGVSDDDVLHRHRVLGVAGGNGEGGGGGGGGEGAGAESQGYGIYSCTMVGFTINWGFPNSAE